VGSIARIFTTLKELGDPIVLAGYAAAFILNGTILAQIIFYGDATPPTPAKKKKE